LSVLICLTPDAVAFEDLDHLPDAGDVFGGIGFEPTNTEPKLVTSEGSWLFQVLVEPLLQFFQLLGG
jgi:hypothetical protein